MPDLTLVLLSAGNSTRFNRKIKKQWIRIKDEPLWLFVANRLKKFCNFQDIIIVANKNEISYMKNFADWTFIEGGNERQYSLKNALNKVKTKYVLVTDVARACIDKNIIDELIKQINHCDIAVPYIKPTDTIHYKNNFIDRNEIKLIQTPQLSKTSILLKALENEKLFTDDSSAVLNIGGKISYVHGSEKAKKLTFFDDIKSLDCLEFPSNDTFCGIGFDVHPFENGKKMYLGGVCTNESYGFKAHSDGDVAIHALIDALLGAMGGGDIGELFPDNDLQYKNADSKKLLDKVVNFIYNVGYEIINVDITIMAQKPKISPFKHQMKEILSEILQIPKFKINIKATTTEKLGFIGREEGVGVQSIATLKYYNWKQ